METLGTGEEKTEKRREIKENISYICICIKLQLSVSKVLSSSYFS